jgi:GIY-YIG catalytic domain-containing protein
MGAGQLWLFDPPKPLVERFGEEFFTTLPTGPGVYFMCGESEGVLYVGKARNLRKRLGSYRVANPERMSRRIIRLLHQVRRIVWDECPTEDAARHREELLICVLAPKFNAAGKVWERKHSALSRFERERKKWEQAGLSLELLKHPTSNIEQPTSKLCVEENADNLVRTLGC